MVTRFFFSSSRPEYSLIRTATSPLSGAVPGCLYDQFFVQTRLDWTGPLLKPVQSSVLSPVSTIDHFTVLVPLPVLYPDQLVFLGQFSHLYSVLFSEGCCCQTISGSRSVLEKKKKKGCRSVLFLNFTLATPVESLFVCSCSWWTAASLFQGLLLVKTSLEFFCSWYSGV